MKILHKLALCLMALYILYAPSADGRIYYAVPDYKYFYFEHTTNRPLIEYHIEDTTPNKALVHDMLKVHGKVDKDGKQKYYFDTTANTVKERKDWEEKPDDAVLSAVEKIGEK